MQKFKFGIVVLIFAFCILNFMGCALFPKKSASAPMGMSGLASLEPQAILKFGDIPVPVGFKLLSNDSYCFENAGMRVGMLRYQGRASANLVTNFYKEQMPMYNWRLLNVVEYGQRILNFDRDNETCIITLLPKWNKQVLVTISVGPKAPGSPKKSDRMFK